VKVLTDLRGKYHRRLHQHKVRQNFDLVGVGSAYSP